MRDQPGRHIHKVPGLRSQIEAELQFGNAPVRLHRRPRIAFDRQASVLQHQDRSVFHHGKGLQLSLQRQEIS
ncbi:hypothetical protein HRbin36_02758 [bacterium HR36]|nr:hypothetical protein HRbin36_02758 [bacterium HR36]